MAESDRPQQLRTSILMRDAASWLKLLHRPNCDELATQLQIRALRIEHLHTEANNPVLELIDQPEVDHQEE